MTKGRVPITQEEIRDLLQKIMITCQRTRSMLMESMEGDQIEPERGNVETEMAALMHPHLFPVPGRGVNIVEAIDRTMNGNRIIEPINVYNILSLADRDSAIYLCFRTYFPNDYLPLASQYMHDISKIMKEEAKNGPSPVVEE